VRGTTGPTIVVLLHFAEKVPFEKKVIFFHRTASKKVVAIQYKPHLTNDNEQMTTKWAALFVLIAPNSRGNGGTNVGHSALRVRRALIQKFTHYQAVLYGN
jgi:hypothetical protein